MTNKRNLQRSKPTLDCVFSRVYLGQLKSVTKKIIKNVFIAILCMKIYCGIKIRNKSKSKDPCGWFGVRRSCLPFPLWLSQVSVWFRPIQFGQLVNLWPKIFKQCFYCNIVYENLMSCYESLGENSFTDITILLQANFLCQFFLEGSNITSNLRFWIFADKKIGKKRF